MTNKIHIFEGKDIDVKSVLNKSYYTHRDFTKVSGDERLMLGGESDVIIYTFSQFAARTISDAKSTGVKPVVVIEDFLSRVDEAVKIEGYIKPLLEISARVIYLAEHKESVDRLRVSGLPIEICE